MKRKSNRFKFRVLSYFFFINLIGDNMMYICNEKKYCWYGMPTSYVSSPIRVYNVYPYRQGNLLICFGCCMSVASFCF